MEESYANEFAAKSLDEFLALVAAGTPTPGGGGAAGLAAALAAALTQMVANLTAGRRKYLNAAADVALVQERATALRSGLLQAVADDSYVYQRVITILQYRTENNDQTLLQSLEDALIGAAQVPLTVAKLSLEVMELSQRMVANGNIHATADAAAAAQLARAAIGISVLNVKTNLREVTDAKLKRSWENQADRIQAKSIGLLAEISETAERRILVSGGQEPSRRRRRSSSRRSDS